MSIGRMRRLVCTMCAVVLLSGLHHFPGKVQGLNVLITSTGPSSRVDVENDLSRSDPAFSLQKNMLGTGRRLRSTEPVEPSEAADEEEVADQEPIPPAWKRKTEGEKKTGAVTERDDDMTVVDVAAEDSGDVSVPSMKGGAEDGRDDDDEVVSSIEQSRAKAGTKSASVSRTAETGGDGMASASTSDAGERSEEEAAAGTDSESLTSPPTTKKRKKKGSAVVEDSVTDDSDGNLDAALLPGSKGTAGKVDSADESSDTFSGAKVPRTSEATKPGEDLEMIDVEGGEEGPSKDSRSKGEVPEADPDLGLAAEEDTAVSKPDSKVESLGRVEEAGEAEGVGAVKAGKAEAMEEEEEEAEEGNEEPVKKTSWLWTAGKTNGKGKGKKSKKGTGAESMPAAAAAEPGDFEAEEGVSPPSGSLSKSESISGRTKGGSGDGAQSNEEAKEGAVSAATVVEGGEDSEVETVEKRTKPKGAKKVEDGDVDPAAEEVRGETPGGPDGDGTDAESGTPAGGWTPSWMQKGKGKGKRTKKPAAEVDETDVEAGQEESEVGTKKKVSSLRSKKGGRKGGPLVGMGDDDDSGSANAEAPIGSEGVSGFAGSPGTEPSKASKPGGGEGLDDDDGVAGGGQGVEESFLGEPTASKVVPDRTFVNAPSSGDVSEKEKSNGSGADHSNDAQSPTALIPNNTESPSLPEGAGSMVPATPPRKRRGKDRKRRGGVVVAGGESPAPAFVPEGGSAGGLIPPPSPSESWGQDSEFSADPGPPPGSNGSRESSTNTSVPEKKGGLGTPSSLYSANDNSKSRPGTVGMTFEGASEDNFDPPNRGSSPSSPVDSKPSPTGRDEGMSEMGGKDAGVSGGGKEERDFPLGEEDIPDTDDSLWAGSKPKADISGLDGEGEPIGDTAPRYEPGTKSTKTEVATPVLKNGEEAPGTADFLAAASKVEEETGGGGGGSYGTFLKQYMYDLMVSPVEAALAPYLTLTQALYVIMALLLLMAAGGCYCWCTMCGRGGGRHGPGYRYDGLELGGGGDEEGRMSSKDLSVAFGQGEAHNGKWDDSWDEDWEAEAARKKKLGSESIGVPRQDSGGTTSIYELKKGAAGTSPSAKKKGTGSKLVVTKGKPVVDEGWEKEWE